MLNYFNENDKYYHFRKTIELIELNIKYSFLLIFSFLVIIPSFLLKYYLY